MAKTKEDKKQIVADLTDKVKRMKSAVFANYEGMTVPQTQELRRALGAEGAEYSVAKKTLLGVAMKKAGKEILKIFHSTQNLTVETKTDNSPVTIADKASNEILVKGLSNRFPNYGILSEETLDNSLRLKKTNSSNPFLFCPAKSH